MSSHLTGIQIHTHLVFEAPESIEVQSMLQFGWQIDTVYRRKTKVSEDTVVTSMIRATIPTLTNAAIFIPLQKIG